MDPTVQREMLPDTAEALAEVLARVYGGTVASHIVHALVILDSGVLDALKADITEPTP